MKTIVLSLLFLASCVPPESGTPDAGVGGQPDGAAPVAIACDRRQVTIMLGNGFRTTENTYWATIAAPPPSALPDVIVWACGFTTDPPQRGACGGNPNCNAGGDIVPLVDCRQIPAVWSGTEWVVICGSDSQVVDSAGNTVSFFRTSYSSLSYRVN